MKKILAILVIAVILIMVVVMNDKVTPVVTVNNFLTCEEAEYPIMESYPRQCRTPEGTLYIEDITHLQESDLVRPDITFGATIKSPQPITGTARGNWFFEAVFPIILEDANGVEIARGIAEAQGDWMTEEYVPFKALLTFTVPQTDTGILVFEKDNPSGLPEYDKNYKIAVVFEKEIVENPKGCVITGCSSQLCAEEDMVSTCEYRESYACYKTATCERQADGKCGWTETTELTQCLNTAL